MVNANLLDQESVKRWRALALLAVTLVLSMTTWFSASAVVPQLRQEWNLSATVAAWLTIAVQLGFVCGALVSGFLNFSDIVPPKHVILGGAFGAAAANGLVEMALSICWREVTPSTRTGRTDWSDARSTSPISESDSMPCGVEIQMTNRSFVK